MNISYSLNTNELSVSFLESIKTLFKDKDLKIIIQEKKDETSFIKSDKNTNEKILKGISESKNKKGINFNSVSDFQKFVLENSNSK